MKRIMTLLAALALTAALAAPARAAYGFESGADTLGVFGNATGYEGTVPTDPMAENIRRNKDAAYLPPPYGVFGGTIDTGSASPLYDNTRESGFAAAGQQFPASGGEGYAPGIDDVYTDRMPSTLQTTALNTAPWFYEDASIGTLYVARTGKSIKIYEGENLDNLKKGAGHFSSTSAWDGNCAFAGHNRGGSAYFSFVKDLQLGDKLTYTTPYGTRTYEVFSKTQIDEWDNSALGYSPVNILTLITCVEGVPDMRWLVQAREVR